MSARTPQPTARSGRRPGNQDTKLAVLQAASEAFASNGFSGTTIRGIAAAAGVDPALVHHYFGSKRELFLATVQVPLDVEAVIKHLAVDDVGGLGARLVSTILRVWDGPAQPALLVALRSILSDPDRSAMFREFVLSQVVRRVLRAAGVPATELPTRSALVFSQMFGVLTCRYLQPTEPLVSMTPDQVAELVGPTVQRYISGDLAS